MKTDVDTFLVETCDDVRVVVKNTFLNTCPSPQGMSRYQLFGEFMLADHMHNTKDYAIAMKEDGTWVGKEFWINGERIPDEEGLRLVHDTEFTEKLVNIL